MVAMNERNPCRIDEEPTPLAQPTSPLEVNVRRVLSWVAIVAVALGIWFWWTGAEERAIRRLPDPARAALYERELASFESVCLADPEPALDAECRHRATVLSWLPECTAECMHSISKVIPVGAPPQNPRGVTTP